MSMTVRAGTAGIIIVLALLITATAFAHGGVTHTNEKEAEAHERSLSIVEMERMIVLLQQLVALLTEQRSMGGVRSVSHIVNIVSTGGHTADAHAGHDGEVGEDGEDGAHDGHDGHSGADGEDGESGEDGADGDDVETFAIEVETHGGKTHVHARYVDKPEAQFFVDADIDDEQALIEAIHEHTDLPKSIIEPALVYL